MGQWYIQNDIPYQKEFPALHAVDAAPELNPWYILTDIPYQKEFELLYDLNEHPVHDGIWKIKDDIPYQPTCVPLIAVNTEPGTDPWYILDDIPYQKGFTALFDVAETPEHEGQWCILNDIPYQKAFPRLYSVDERPPYAKQWYILDDIPYQKWFPELVAINAEPEDGPWYILTDIPYRKEFVDLYDITDAPIHQKQWYILEDIPYQKDFSELLSVDAEPNLGQWYILNDIPYMKEFVELLSVDEVPMHGDQWYILDDIPYQKGFAELVAVDDEPYDGPWYISNNIPYRIEFVKLDAVTETPLHEGQWFILEDIPYQKAFPALIHIDAEPDDGQWYILDDIPYMKEFPELIAVTELPAHIGQWYILDDIPYMKEFVDLIPIDAVPRNRTWYILNDIPYMKEFPRLYPLEPIPIPNEKHYYTVGQAAIGRWQVRTSPFSQPDDWTLIEDLGPISVIRHAYIEADGNFDYIAGNDSITLTTTDTPWMAVITTTKKLYVKQVCADIETAILLDTGVEQASLCRGWKSDKYSVDSGLICAYRKADGVYAKVYKKIDGEYVWETLPQLLYEPVDHVEVKRMNDYRIGVYVTNPNRLLLSERFYIGGTSKTEYISVKLKPWTNVCSFSMVGEPAEKTFKVERCWMEEDTKVRMHCNYPIVSFDPDYPNLTLTDDYNYSKLVEYYIQNGDLVCILDKPKYSSFNTIRIVIPSINRILYQITPQFKHTIPGSQYAVENPPIAEYIDVQITAAAGILSTIEKQEYRYNYDTEHISVTLTAQAGRILTTELNQQAYKYDIETILVSVSATAGVFTMTQEGDLPI